MYVHWYVEAEFVDRGGNHLKKKKVTFHFSKLSTVKKNVLQLTVLSCLQIKVGSYTFLYVKASPPLLKFMTCKLYCTDQVVGISYES